MVHSPVVTASGPVAVQSRALTFAQFINMELNWRWNSQECTQQPYGMPVLRAEAKLVCYSTDPSALILFERLTEGQRTAVPWQLFHCPQWPQLLPKARARNSAQLSCVARGDLVTSAITAASLCLHCWQAAVRSPSWDTNLRPPLWGPGHLLVSIKCPLQLSLNSLALASLWNGLVWSAIHTEHMHSCVVLCLTCVVGFVLSHSSVSSRRRVYPSFRCLCLLTWWCEMRLRFTGLNHLCCFLFNR